MLNTPLRGAIVAMNADNVIGLNGDLPWHYAADLQRFKQRTLHHAIIMGRLTWESLGCKALPKRRNIVISRKPVESVECYTSIEHALNAIGDDDVWFIGGGQIYRAAMPYTNLLDITYVPDVVTAKHLVTFPEIDPRKWQLQSSETFGEHDELKNAIYHRIAQAQ